MGKAWSTKVLVCKLDFRLRDAGIPEQLVVEGNILTKLRDGGIKYKISEMAEDASEFADLCDGWEEGADLQEKTHDAA